MRLTEDERRAFIAWLSDFLVLEAEGDPGLTAEFICTYLEGGEMTLGEATKRAMLEELAEVNDKITSRHLDTIFAAMRDKRYAKNQRKNGDGGDSDGGRGRSRSRSRSWDRLGRDDRDRERGKNRAAERREPRRDRSRSRERGAPAAVAARHMPDARDRERERERERDFERQRERGGRGGARGMEQERPVQGGYHGYGDVRDARGAAPPPYGASYVGMPMSMSMPIPPMAPMNMNMQGGGAPYGVPTSGPYGYRGLQGPPGLTPSEGQWDRNVAGYRNNHIPAHASHAHAPHTGSMGYAVPSLPVPQAPYAPPPSALAAAVPASTTIGVGGWGPSATVAKSGTLNAPGRAPGAGAGGGGNAGDGLRTLKVVPAGDDHTGITELAVHFSRYGKVTNVMLPQHGGVAYVQFLAHEMAEAALNGRRQGELICGDPSIQASWASHDSALGPPGERGEGSAQSKVRTDGWRDAIFGRGGVSSGDGHGHGHGHHYRDRNVPNGHEGGTSYRDSNAPPSAPVPHVKRESGVEAAKRVMDEKAGQSAALAVSIAQQKARINDLAARKGSMTKVELAAAMKEVREEAARIKAAQDTLNAALRTAAKAVELQAHSASAARSKSGVSAVGGAVVVRGESDPQPSPLDGREREARMTLDEEGDGAATAGGAREDDDGRRGDNGEGEVDIQLEDE